MNRIKKINNFHIRRNISLTFGLMAITMLMIQPLILTESYAAETTLLEWQLLFIQEDSCNQSDILNEVYSSLTLKYFELYQLENIVHEAYCMTELEYSEYKVNEDVDLLILVYDDKLGEKVLQPNKVDGLYIHSGNDRSTNHLLIMCHCSDFNSSYEQILPSWILTHELSHFVLSYKGFPRSIIYNAVHEIEAEYDNCIGTNFQSQYCDNFKLTLRPDNQSKDFPVMKPYEDAVGQKLVQYIPEDFSDSKIINLQRDLAKMWIKNEIDDNAFSNTLKNFVDGPIENDHEYAEPFMEIKNGFVIAEKSKPKDIQWDEYLEPETQNQDYTHLLYEYIPFNLEESAEEINFQEMPNWFKTRAILWSEKRISDKVFFDGVEHLIRIGIINFS